MRIFIVLLCFNCACLYSQETIDVKFNEANPLWVHTMIDTTFLPVPGQAYFTKYSSLYPHIISRDASHMFILSPCQEKQTLNDRGFVLDKIDINTGTKIWSHYNTPYNNGDYDFYHEINLTKNGNIELFGVYVDTLFNTYPILKSLNLQDGKLLNKVISKDKLIDYSIRHYRPFKLNTDSAYLITYLHGGDVGTLNEPIYKYGLRTEYFDIDLVRQKEFWQFFNFDTLGPFSIDQGSLLHRLNGNTIVSLAYKDRYTSWDNLGTKLMWTDISNPNDIKIKQIKDYTDIVPGTKESFALHRFNTINNTIYLSHYYPNFDIQNNTCYILWLDSIGEIKTFIPIPKYNNHIYQFADMFYANNEFAYLFSFPSVTGKQGFDIIRIESGKDTIQFVSSITVKNEGEEFGTQVNALYDDGYLIFGGLAKKIGQGTKTSTKFYCFKASDLKIDFKPVATKDITKEGSGFRIFPNPTSNTLYLQLSHMEKNLKLNVYDINCQLVLIENLDQVINQIDISSLPKGVYLVNVSNSKGEKIGKTEKMVKVE